MTAFGFFPQCLGIMMAQFSSFFRWEIRFFGRMEVFFHLFYNVFCFYEILNFQVRRRLDHVMGMPADWAELPFLEPVNVSECPAGRTPDDEVHDKDVMSVIPIKIYRPIINSERNFGYGNSFFWCEDLPSPLGTTSESYLSRSTAPSTTLLCQISCLNVATFSESLKWRWNTPQGFPFFIEHFPGLNVFICNFFLKKS